MITKVLIAEDHESANISVQKTLEDLKIDDIAHVYYCDDALSRIATAAETDCPFDLLITDLYFEPDAYKQKIPGGKELISAARAIQPGLKILVFSAENKPAVIGLLFSEFEIDGFVRKARNDARELKEAINEIAQHRSYIPHHIRQAIDRKNTYIFSEFDVTIIRLLAQGVLQKNIPAYLQQRGMTPSGLSSVEKKLNLIKEAIGCTTNQQLIARCIEMGVI